MNTNDELTAIDKNRLVLMDFEVELYNLRTMIHDSWNNIQKNVMNS